MSNSNKLQKLAFPENPLDLLVLSALAGGGVFGGGRLLRNMMQSASGVMETPEEKRVKNKIISLDIPKEQLQNSGYVGKIAQEIVKEALFEPGSVSYEALRYGSIPAGLGLGYFGTKKIYDALEQRKREAELKSEQEKYLNLLKQVQLKTAELNTPLIDGFCLEMAEKVQKEAEELDSTLDKCATSVDLSSFSGERTARVFGENLWNKASTLPGIRNILGAALLLGVGTGGLTYLAARNKAKQKEEPTSPTVQVNYV